MTDKVQIHALDNNSHNRKMEVKSLNDGYLTNSEVMELIRERRASRSSQSSKLNIDFQHRESVEQKVHSTSRTTLFNFISNLSHFKGNQIC
jgi:hypothetical protein